MQDWSPSKRLTHSSRARLLAVAAVASGVLVAGCGGSSNGPSVASVTSTTTSRTSSAPSTGAVSTASSGGAAASRSSTTTGPRKSSPALLLVEWASCMRSHGDPNQADPTVTANKLIAIPWNPAIPGGYNGTYKGGQGNSGPGQYCRTYLAAAASALRGGRPEKRPDPAAMVKLAECMRANGVPDFPDPAANGSLILPGNPDQNANNPTFQNASRVCARKTGVNVPGRSGLPPGTITLTGP